jgi:WD40 repeat protein
MDFPDEVRILARETGVLVESHSGRGFAWSPDSQSLAIGEYSQDGHIRVVDLKTGALQFESPCVLNQDIDWTAHGNLLAWSGQDQPMVVFDWSRKVRLGELGPPDVYWCVRFSPDGQRIAAGSTEGDVRIWGSRGEGAPLRLEHKSAVGQLSWSRDGRYLASASWNLTIIWDTIGGVEVERLEHGAGAVFHPNGGILATAYRELVLWDVEHLVPTRRLAPDYASDTARYLSRQAITVGRSLSGFQSAELWVPNLPGAEGPHSLGTLASDDQETNHALCLSRNSRTLFLGHQNGSLSCWNLETGNRIWQVATHSDRVNRVVLSPNDREIASIGNDSHELAVSDVSTGERHWQIQTELRWQVSLAWSPDGRFLAAGDASGQQLGVFSALSGERLRVWEIGEQIKSVHWSPGGRKIAIGGDRGLLEIWDFQANSVELRLNGHEKVVWDLRWSPDGKRLASAGGLDNTCRIWEAATGEVLAVMEGHEDSVHRARWRPDGQVVASSAYDKKVRIWDAGNGRELECFDVESSRQDSDLAWSSDGAFLAAVFQDSPVRFFDTRHLLPAGQPAVPVSPSIGHASLPSALAPLPAALAEMHRLDIYPPLSLVHDLLQLTGGQPVSGPLDALARHPGIKSLAALRWPTASRIGLAPVLLHELPLEGWEPPEELPPSRLRKALASALADSSDCSAEPPAVSMTLLEKQAEQIDERVLTLLALLGPEAVAADPGVVLRLLPRAAHLHALDAEKRRRLGARLRAGNPGHSSGAGAGVERAGVDLRGDLRSLLPSQLALPPQVMSYRHLRGELLYRARLGAEPPRLRPAVVLLDVSPACFGPIEEVTRLAAHIVLSSLQEAGQAAVLVTTGGVGTVRMIERPADLLEVWTARTLEPAQAARSLAIARGMREQLRDGHREPVLIVLSHAWFGAEDDRVPMDGLRGLFVQYPGQQVHPPLALSCEKWETITPARPAPLPSIMGRLAG